MPEILNDARKERTGRPGATAVGRATPQHEQEAYPGFGQIDHFRPNPISSPGPLELVPSVALIHKNRFGLGQSGLQAACMVECAISPKDRCPHLGAFF